jgi:hypothetical protein
MYSNRIVAPCITRESLKREYCSGSDRRFWRETESASPVEISYSPIPSCFSAITPYAKNSHQCLTHEGLLTPPYRAQKCGAERPTTQPNTENETSSYALSIFPSPLPATSTLRPAFPCPDLSDRSKANELRISPKRPSSSVRCSLQLFDFATLDACLISLRRTGKRHDQCHPPLAPLPQKWTANETLNC